MGVSISASAKKGGCEVYWTSEGRSAATRERAAKVALHHVNTLTELCERCSVLVSACPPHAAEGLANEVLKAGFRGLFVEANAIAPQLAIKIGETMSRAGVSFVDGGIIGPPAWQAGTTRLYLSGTRASEVAACFTGGPLEARVLGTEIGKASALKMCYAANTKGTLPLLAAMLAAAESLGVREALFEHWRHEDPVVPHQVENRLQAAKAWRFVGEMGEISRTFSEAGVPGEFHAAAANIYERLEGFKNRRTPPSLEEILAALVTGGRTRIN